MVKVSAANMNIDQIALEMLLDALERGQSVVMYGTGTSMGLHSRGDASLSRRLRT